MHRRLIVIGSIITGIGIISAGGSVQATVLLQMTAPDKLKFELFTSKTADEVTDFTTAAQLYTR